MHQPVMLREVVDWMNLQETGTYIDGTLGGGGHAAAILDLLGDAGRVIGIDRDLQTLRHTTTRLEVYGDKFIPVHGNFAEIKELAGGKGVKSVDGIILDLGVSSFQLDTADRGFSFQQSGPLDMRMDPSRGPTAADLVNTLSEKELSSLIFRYGEERHARRIARAIVSERGKEPILTTGRLVGIVEKALGGRRGRIHPATRTFQALRIQVNEELESLQHGLEEGLALLNTGGRMMVISFHSLEDRIVKKFFARHAGRRESLPQGGDQWVGEYPPVHLLTRKPLTATEDETISNPRARSAKMRVVERINHAEEKAKN